MYDSHLVRVVGRAFMFYNHKFFLFLVPFVPESLFFTHDYLSFIDWQAVNYQRSLGL